MRDVFKVEITDARAEGFLVFHNFWISVEILRIVTFCPFCKLKQFRMVFFREYDDFVVYRTEIYNFAAFGALVRIGLNAPPAVKIFITIVNTRCYFNFLNIRA